MPRGKQQPSSEGRREFERIWAAQTGAAPDFMLTDWDGDAQVFYDAIMCVLSTKASVFIRPGSGGRAIGIAIWEGDDRYPATWFYEPGEVDAWAKSAIGHVEALKAKHKP